MKRKLCLFSPGKAQCRYENLVQRMSDELYRKELRHGGGALDIGLFGSRLFDRDVVQALKEGDGVLWEIS